MVKQINPNPSVINLILSLVFILLSQRGFTPLEFVLRKIDLEAEFRDQNEPETVAVSCRDSLPLERGSIVLGIEPLLFTKVYFLNRRSGRINHGFSC
jgi:hypothetical protein